jgi:ATP-dependent Clp protease ATP-binding subunit ClpA
MLACEEARQRGDRRVGTEHLLLGLLRDPAIEDTLGVTHEQTRLALTEIDNEALASIGMPAEMNTPPLPERPHLARPSVFNVWKGHLKMTPSAKSALKEFARPMRHHKPVHPQQLLLSLLDNQSPDAVAVVLSRLCVDTTAIRSRLESEFSV